jgi:hypothetical protein
MSATNQETARARGLEAVERQQRQHGRPDPCRPTGGPKGETSLAPDSAIEK